MLLLGTAKIRPTEANFLLDRGRFRRIKNNFPWRSASSNIPSRSIPNPTMSLNTVEVVAKPACRTGRQSCRLRRTVLVMTMIFILLFFMSASHASSSHYPDKYYEGLYQHIESFFEKNDKKEMDFWMARYLGMSTVDAGTQKSPKDLDPLIKKRALLPVSFLSSDYDPEFIDWFVKSSYANWGVKDARVREKSGVYEIRAVIYKDYFLTIAATPEIQSWFLSGDTSSPLVLALSSLSSKPFIYSGKLVNQDPMLSFPGVNLDVGKRQLLYCWIPEFYDLDGDGIPEVWIRYNVTALNGFSQILAIYKIQDDNQLVLFKEFKQDNEGVARRLDQNRVQIGHGFGSKPNLSHMSYDQYHLEILEFSDGSFHKVTEENRTHILRNKEWKKYYLDEQESWMQRYKNSS